MTKAELKAKATSASYPPPTKAGRKVLQTLIEEHPVDMTDADKLAAGLELSKQVAESANHEVRTKQVLSELTARRNEIRANISQLGLRVHNGTHLKSVNLQVEADYDNGVVETIRVDTGDVIRTRPLKSEERQGTIFESPTDETNGFKAGEYEPDAPKSLASGDTEDGDTDDAEESSGSEDGEPDVD